MHLNSYGDTMFMAIEWALQDREALHDAYDTKTEKDQIQREIRALLRLKKALFGDQKTKLEAEIERAVPVSLAELRRMVRDGEIENRADQVPED